MSQSGGRQTEADDNFHSSRLEQVFAACFERSHNTRLLGGHAEPLYQPAVDNGSLHTLYYRHDHFASALHEVAHWCIAGEERRRLVDFGYWYHPDGRGEMQQKAFEQVESQPQALEWFFSQACGFSFRVSVDNLDTQCGRLPDTRAFNRRIVAQARYWQQTQLPERADIFFTHLCTEFGQSRSIRQLEFTQRDLL